MGDIHPANLCPRCRELERKTADLKRRFVELVANLAAATKDSSTQSTAFSETQVEQVVDHHAWEAGRNCCPDCGGKLEVLEISVRVLRFVSFVGINDIRVLPGRQGEMSLLRIPKIPRMARMTGCLSS